MPVDVAQDDDAVTDDRARNRRRRSGDFEPGVRCDVRPHRLGQAERIRGRPDDVAEDRARFDGCQLFRVTHQHDAGTGPDRLEQPRHQRERDHGRLVHHDHVLRQVVLTVVTEPGSVAWVESQQAVDRGAAEAVQHLTCRVPDRRGQPPRRGRPLRGAPPPCPSALRAHSAGAAVRRHEPVRRAGPGHGQPWSSCPFRARPRSPTPRSARPPPPRSAGGGRDPRRCRTGARCLLPAHRPARPPRAGPPGQAGRTPRGTGRPKAGSGRAARQYRWRGLSSPTTGLSAIARTHAAPSGHGRASTSASASVSLLAVPRTDSRSTHTWPSRGARTAKATPRRRASSSTPARSLRRTATWTSDGASKPAALNRPSGPSSPIAADTSKRLSTVTAARLGRRGR